MSSEMPIMGYATESKGPKVFQTLKPASRLVFEFLDSFIILVNLPNKSFHCYLERLHVSDIRTLVGLMLLISKLEISSSLWTFSRFL